MKKNKRPKEVLAAHLNRKADRPREVLATHLTRKAVVYVRQSSDTQVRLNTGSTADQRDQARHARAMGWPESAIQVIDGDLGLSGTTSVHRAGYIQMVDQIRAGLVGAIFVSDISRAGRNSLELIALLEECRTFNVLLVVDGRISDLSDSGQLFTNQIVSMVVQFENARRREALERGKIAKVKSGKAVSRPPTGYVADREGCWEMDPDPAIRAGIAAVLHGFLEARSLPRTVSLLQKRGIRIPRRDNWGNLEWKDARIDIIAPIVRNVLYVGGYVFRRTRVDPSKGRMPSGDLRTRKALPEESIILSAHHEPYISHREWEEIQHILKINAPSKARRNLGPGSALPQGVLRCGRHPTRVMNPGYQSRRADGRYTHSYLCLGDYVAGGKFCPTVTGAYLDRAVVKTIMERLRVPSLQVLRELWEKFKENETSETHRRQVELQRARLDVADARKRCCAVSPENRHVLEEYEAMFEAAKVRLKQLEQMISSDDTSDPAFTEEKWNQMLALATDVEALWNAKTTIDRDRKEIIRTMITSVIIETRSREEIQARIIWSDGEPDTTLDVKLVPYMHRVIIELAVQGKSASEIADYLNERGLRNLQGNNWIASTVRTLITRKKVEGKDKNAA